MPENTQPFRSAFVALVGRPNSGKSSLLNAVLGEKLSIVTSLPQTTRRNLKGIYNEDNLQLVFVDSPGIHKGDHLFNKSMYAQGLRLVCDESIDIVCYLVDLFRPAGEEEDVIANEVVKCSADVCLVFNKTDIVDSVDDAKTAFLSRYPALADYTNVCLSALSEGAAQTFLDAIRPKIPEGPQYYPSDDLTDSDMRFFAAEYIRERIIAESRQEVPHATFVEILSYQENEDGHLIDADIHVETQGQKGILIGNKGSLIRKIQKDAASRMADLAGLPVKIQCHIRVTPKWRDNRRFLSGVGVDFK